MPSRNLLPAGIWESGPNRHMPKFEKTRDRVQSGMRAFESAHSSQAFRRSARLPGKGENGRKCRSFDFVSRLPNRQSEGANRRKSLVSPVNIPILQRLSAETGFDHGCRPQRAAIFRVISFQREAQAAFLCYLHLNQADLLKVKTVSCVFHRKYGFHNAPGHDDLTRFQLRVPRS